MPRKYVAVCGASDATRTQLDAAREVVGLLPGTDREGANPHLTISLPSGMGQARNVLIVTAAESVIAIGEGWGTLSEIALARRLGRAVFALDTWKVKGLDIVHTPAEAVKRALEN